MKMVRDHYLEAVRLCQWVLVMLLTFVTYCRSTNVRARLMFANFAILTNSQTLIACENL